MKVGQVGDVVAKIRKVVGMQKLRTTEIRVFNAA